MTCEEAKNALLSQCPVYYKGREYAVLKEIIYWRSKYGKINVSLKIMDNNYNSAVIARLAEVSLKRESE